MDVAPTEDARRLRAAQAWKGLSDEELASALGVSKRTVGRMRSGEARLDAERKARIAEVTGVPEWFMQSGFDRGGDGDLEGRIAQLEDSFRELRSTVATRLRPRGG